MPITKPIVFQAGFTVTPVDASTVTFPASNGQTLSRTPLNVPDGQLGLMDTRSFGGPLLQAFQNAVRSSNAVTATAELVGPARIDYLDFLISEGPAASGCGYLPLDKLLVTGAVNLKEGLPAAAGKNAAIFNGDATLADANTVRASAELPPRHARKARPRSSFTPCMVAVNILGGTPRGTPNRTIVRAESRRTMGFYDHHLQPALQD